MSETDILEQYPAQVFVRGGELYLSLPKALNSIADCYQNNLAVIGFVILSEKEWISSDRESYLREYQTIG